MKHSVFKIGQALLFKWIINFLKLIWKSFWLVVIILNNAHNYTHVYKVSVNNNTFDPHLVESTTDVQPTDMDIWLYLH